MTSFKLAQELKHPGFILFEGMDLAGKSALAKHTARRIQEDLGIKVGYSYNQGFLKPDLVDATLLDAMNPEEKSDYILDCYLKDSLTVEPREFQEIMQDKHAPCMIFYAITRGNKNIENLTLLMQQVIKPKHIFLVECSYENRLKRSEERQSLRTLEKMSLSSQETHNKFVDLYRRIIENFNVPFTIIDTTNALKEESIEECLSKIKTSGALTHTVTVDELVVDFEPRVYESTSNIRFDELRNGLQLEPVKVTRRIDGAGGYVDVISDGRHRAFAAKRHGLKTIAAYVDYESVNKIDDSNLRKISEFTFKT